MQHTDAVNRIRRVLAFLETELGSSQVTLLVGHADARNVLFYSNMPLHGYTQTNGIYTKNAGNQEDWNPETQESFRSRYLGDARYHTMSNTTIHKKDGRIINKKTTRLPPSIVEATIFSTDEPYAWNHSQQLGKLFDPEYKDQFPFPWDIATCHEGAHGLLKPYEDMLEAQDDAAEEALAHRISTRYLQTYYPEDLERLYEYFKSAGTDRIHMAAFKMVINDDPILDELERQVRAKLKP